MKRYGKIIYLVFLILFLSACGRETVKFQAGDVKADFCGTHLNYQYCECAFKNEFCQEIGMGSKEAKDFVMTEYDEWVLKESMAFKEQCGKANGVFKDDECKYCSEGKIVEDGKCVRENSIAKSKEEGSQVIADVTGTCEGDNDCPSACQNNVLLARKCNPDTKVCEKISERDCALDIESFGDFVFPMLCRIDKCQRDSEAIEVKKAELQAELGKYEPQLSMEDAGRTGIGTALSQTRKYCQPEETNVSKDGLNAYTATLASSTESVKESIDEGAKFQEFLDNLKIIADKNELLDADYSEIKNISCSMSDFLQSALDKLPVGNEELRNKAKEIETAIGLLP